MTSKGGGRRLASRARLAAVAAIAVAVAAALYLAGRAITPDYTAGLFGRRGIAAVALKSGLATVVLAFAAVQLLLAAWMYRKLPLAGAAPRRVPPLHRLAGLAAFAVTVPVALHCLVAYGVQLTGPRVAAHSLAGCFLYGAFAAKVLIVRSRRMPGWALPVAGGTLATLIVILWYTSALWYYGNFRLPAL